MLKVVFKTGGSIKELVAPNYVTQGSHGALNSLKLATAVDGLDLTDYIITAECRTPDNKLSSISLDSFDEEEGLYFGYLTEAQTYYAGTLYISIRIEDENENVLYSYNVPVVVNPTTYEPTGLSDNITNEQYVDLIKKIKNSKTIVSVYSTYAEANTDKDNLEVDQIIYVKDSNELYVVTQVSGSTAKLLRLISRNHILVTDGAYASEMPSSGTFSGSSVTYDLEHYLVSSIHATTHFGASSFGFWLFKDNDGTNSYFEKLTVTATSITSDVITIVNSTGAWTRSVTTIKDINVPFYLRDDVPDLTSVTITSGEAYGTLTPELLTLFNQAKEKGYFKSGNTYELDYFSVDKAYLSDERYELVGGYLYPTPDSNIRGFYLNVDEENNRYQFVIYES